MALTEQAFQAWLEEDNTERCTLAEITVNISGTETVIYLSNKNYNTTPTDTPANIAYLPIINTSLSYSESISLDGTPSLSFGDIEVGNIDGEYDGWLAATHVWAERPISIFIGDPSGTRDNFTRVYKGIVSDISSRDNGSINFSIRDMLEKLNKPITDVVVGGIGTNKEAIRPLVFGEVHNISPVQTSAVTLTYMAHNGPIESIIEVRDNGVPLTHGISYTTDLALGTFTLLVAPAGTITCSVQGEKNTIDGLTGNLTTGVWASTIARIIQLVITKYGNNPIVPADMDLVAIEAFNTANPTPVGIYVKDSTNIITVCQELAASVGAQFTSTRNGLITLLKVAIPITDAVSTVIDDNSIIQNTLQISNKVPVVSAVKIAYCKNWTVQPGLLTGIPESSKLLFGEEYLVISVEDAAVKTLYKLSAETPTKETLLVTNDTSAVTNEANRLLNLWKEPRFVYSMECVSKFLTIKLGQMVKLTHNRFALNAKSAQVITVNTNWDNGSVSIEVLV